YVYDPDDYPFQVPNSVVINEILAHSAGGAPDWIELYNSSSNSIDIGGWFLSDSGSDLQKYLIAAGTTIPAGGYLVFYEDQHFGAASTDPGKITPFAISENGETVHLLGPAVGLLLPYHETESFGPSATDVSKGRYFKSSTSTFNFVAMASQSPGGPNGLPLVGPIVISEIMYHPLTGNAEFVELLNIANTPVTLFDAAKNEPWRITQGFTFDFPSSPSVTMQPGERILLVQNMTLFLATYTIPAGVQVFQWSAGALSNSGEKIELSSPGDLDGLNQRQYIRLDRVTYEDGSPWPPEPDSGLHSLTRIDDTRYGNDPANWIAAAPTPGQSAFGLWAASQGLLPGNNSWDDDPDGDRISNLIEFGTNSNPLSPTPAPAYPITVIGPDEVRIRYEVAADRPDLGYVIQRSLDLTPGSWTDLPGTIVPAGGTTLYLDATDSYNAVRMFYRLAISP
ncbi:MAG: lamin tail domain-containing protein, partial [Roseibacillus sp.]